MATTVTSGRVKLRNFIGGELVEPADGQTEEVLDPATLEVIGDAPLSTEEDVDRAVAAARKAFDGWWATTPGERANCLYKLAEVFEEHAEEIADLESADAGKPRGEARGEVDSMVDNLRFFAGAGRTMSGLAAGEYMEGKTSFVRREPVGVVGQITPWNYPLMMAVWKIGPALATGNTVVLKPAETTPMTTLKMAEWAADVFPPGVLNVIGGHGEPAGAPLVRHPDVDMVSLTGSPPTGKWIAAAAAETLKKVHLELGGKAPVVVFDDVDMETALATIAEAGYYNAGQDCTAATRVLASKKVYDDVVNGLVSRGRQAGRRADPRRRHDARTGQLGGAARADRGLPRAQARQRRDRHRRQRIPTCPATTSSRPSWPACSSRTTS